MFNRPRRKLKSKQPPLPPSGIAEVSLCVFDDRKRLLHSFCSFHPDSGPSGVFDLLGHAEDIAENGVLAEALSLHYSSSVSIFCENGTQKMLHVLPFKSSRDRWYFTCLQITAEQSVSAERAADACGLSGNHVCLLMVGGDNTILSAGSIVPPALGYSPNELQGMNLSHLFSPADLNMIQATSIDSNESLRNCVLHCLDNSARDVEVKKYSVLDGYTLYGICDVTRPHEGCVQISTRERRRIGQDLHDSIGQLLTGISLLSRSLANDLTRVGHPGDADAIQISELANDASNQIRQISRGLMPSEIVKNGLFISLRELARITSDSCGLHCCARLDETVIFSDAAVETHLYRIAQEAINNAVRHAHATEIIIIIGRHNGLPQLEISDNGVWNHPSGQEGMGMKTMEYRASVIGGHLMVSNRPGGTSIVCRLDMDDFTDVRGDSIGTQQGEIRYG
ncbi:MAG TPA: sensor histidine kinase [Pontiella sp.]